MKKENVIQSKSFEFALEVIEIYKQLVAQKEFVLSKQLLRREYSEKCVKLKMNQLI